MKPWNHCAATVLGLFHMTTRPPPKDKLSSGSEDTATQEPGHGRDGCNRPGPGPGGVPGRPPAAWGPLAAPLAAASPGGWGCASRGAGGRPPGTPRPTRAAPRPSPRGCSRSAWCVPPHPMRYAAPLDSPRAGGLVCAAAWRVSRGLRAPQPGPLPSSPGPPSPQGPPPPWPPGSSPPPGPAWSRAAWCASVAPAAPLLARPPPGGDQAGPPGLPWWLPWSPSSRRPGVPWWPLRGGRGPPLVRALLSPAAPCAGPGPARRGVGALSLAPRRARRGGCCRLPPPWWALWLRSTAAAEVYPTDHHQSRAPCMAASGHP